MNDFASRVRNRRLALHMTQSELADKLGYVSRSSVAKLEAGASDLPRSKIESLAETLETTPAYLMGWTDDPEDYSKAEELNNLPEDWYGKFDDETAVKAYHAMHDDTIKESSSAKAKELTVDEVVRALTAVGFIKPGQDLSDEDLRFLMSLADAVESWFANKSRNKE